MVLLERLLRAAICWELGRITYDLNDRVAKLLKISTQPLVYRIIAGESMLILFCVLFWRLWGAAFHRTTSL